MTATCAPGGTCAAFVTAPTPVITAQPFDALATTRVVVLTTFEEDEEIFEAMRAGNLEMAWMQMGKAAPVEPRMMAVVGPGVLTTVGAVDSLEKTRTYQQLVERLSKNQNIKVFGAAHMSFGMGVGGAKRYLKPEDSTGPMLRTLRPVKSSGLR